MVQAHHVSIFLKKIRHEKATDVAFVWAGSEGRLRANRFLAERREKAHQIFSRKN